MAKAGDDIIMAGLALQLVWFGVFVIVAATFHRRLALKPTMQSQQLNYRWRRFLTTLYVASTLIIVRSLFRIIEYAGGNDGYLFSQEAFLYVFDALLMFIVVSWLNWRHPGEIGMLLRYDSVDGTGLRLLHLRSMSKGSAV